jgi:hypothetical protein
MSDFIPKPGGVRIGGLSPKAQKLQALREKAAAANNKTGAQPLHATNAAQAKPKTSFAGKKPSFQRKAV